MPSKVQKVQTDSREVNQLQSNVVPALNGVLALPMVDQLTLTNVSLTTGSNTINHGLNRPLVGWIITRKRASATIWDTQDSNSSPDLTLLLSTSADCVVDLVVF